MLSISHAPKARRSALVVVMATVLVASFLTGSLPVAHAQGAPDLFSDAGSGAGTVTTQASSAALVRSRYVHVNMGLLLSSSGAARTASDLPQVALNLFPDVNYTGVVDHVQKADADSTSWSGSLSGVDGGYFYLVESGGSLIAHVASTQGVYEVSSVGNDLYRVVQIQQSKLLDEPNDGQDIPTDNSPAPKADANVGAAALPPTIDVMVVYTAAALAGEGSLPALKARIALAIVESNQSYANSGIAPRLRLVHIQQVSYAETGNLTTDVHRLAGTADGFMDNVHALRNLYGADVVTLIVENGNGLCGMADAIKASAATAFDVVQRNACLTGYYSFAHELGHLQGARHDVAVDPIKTPYAYGHGYVNLPALWRTVMAYDKKCTDNGVTCTRLQYWSNPVATYGGAAMGDATARNYVVLNTTAATVANFRKQAVSNNFSSNFNSSATGWVPVFGKWPLAQSAFYTTTGIADVLSSTKHVGKYGDLTFTVRMRSIGPCTGCANVIIIRGNPLSLSSDKVWKSAYIFEYNNSGVFSVWRQSGSGGTPLKAWTSSPVIVKGGWNTVKVVAVGNLLRFFINAKLVWSGFNSAYTTGQVGVGMYRSSGSIAERLFVDSATLSTTPTTGDVNPFADAVPGVTVLGGDMMHAP
jgi:peptidyl-Asp metalloendopeptidase